MAHVITSLCLRDGSCALVCPVECIIPGKPEGEWPWYYIDADTCIDCDACVAECPYGAIFTEDDVPSAFQGAGKVLSMPVGTPGYTTPYDGKNHDGEPVHLNATRLLQAGETVDLTPAIQANLDYFRKGAGYKALEM